MLSTHLHSMQGTASEFYTSNPQNSSHMNDPTHNKGTKVRNSTPSHLQTELEMECKVWKSMTCLKC